MAEKELPYDNEDDFEVQDQTSRPDLSAQRRAASSMFASADKIIQDVRNSDSLSFIRQSKQSGGQ